MPRAAAPSYTAPGFGGWALGSLGFGDVWCNNFWCASLEAGCFDTSWAVVASGLWVEDAFESKWGVCFPRLSCELQTCVKLQTLGLGVGVLVLEDWRNLDKSRGNFDSGACGL